MPWQPPDEEMAHARDARLDPYRERAAILSGRGDLEATLYIVFADGGFDDWLVAPQELDKDLADWSHSKLRYVGAVLDVEWLDDAASRHARDHVLGPDSP